MDYVLGIDVYALNSPDDTANARRAGVADEVTKSLIQQGADWKEIIDPVKATANWKAVHDAGVKFAYIKATEFRADMGFSARMQFAKDAGLLRGAYILPHFELDNIPDQVDLFVKTVGSDQGELPPMLDLETPGGNWPKGKTLMKKVKDCLDRLEKAFRRKPIIYTSNTIVTSYEITNPRWGNDYPLWLAQYPWVDVESKRQYSDPNNPPKWSSTYPQQPDGYQPWIMWQWTEKGRLNGLGEENVDIDSFKGTYEEFLKWADAKEPIPVSLPEQPVPAPAPQPEDSRPEPGPVPDPVAREGNFIMYKVKPNDALGLIAEEFHTTVEAIMALNPQIKNPNIIGLGWELKIPTS